MTRAYPLISIEVLLTFFVTQYRILQICHKDHGTSTTGKRKSKPSVLGEATEPTPDPAQQRTIPTELNLSPSSLEVVEKMYPPPAAAPGQSPDRGGVRWNHFLSVMVEIGFGYETQDGSEYCFTYELAGGRTLKISFHEPDKKVGKEMLRQYGKRIQAMFGWEDPRKVFGLDEISTDESGTDESLVSDGIVSRRRNLADNLQQSDSTPSTVFSPSTSNSTPPTTPLRVRIASTTGPARKHSSPNRSRPRYHPYSRTTNHIKNTVQKCPVTRTAASLGQYRPNSIIRQERTTGTPIGTMLKTHVTSTVTFIKNTVKMATNQLLGALNPLDGLWNRAGIQCSNYFGVLTTVPCP